MRGKNASLLRMRARPFACGHLPLASPLRYGCPAQRKARLGNDDGGGSCPGLKNPGLHSRGEGSMLDI